MKEAPFINLTKIMVLLNHRLFCSFNRYFRLTLVKDKLYVTSLGANIDEGDLSLYESELSSDHKK